jgi:hypothetical protein
VSSCLDQYNYLAHTDPKRLENAGAVAQIQRESDQSWQEKAWDAL